MIDADRYRLLGTYRTPRVRVGRLLTCEARDCDVTVTGYSSARIPWPKGRRVNAKAVALVVYGSLARAVRTESNLAVAYWFGVTPKIVSKWRKVLGVEPTNAGTRTLRQRHGAEPWFAEVRAKGQAAAWTDDRRRQHADQCRGKPRPRHVIEAMRKGRTGKPHTAEAREDADRPRPTQGSGRGRVGRPPDPGRAALIVQLDTERVHGLAGGYFVAPHFPGVNDFSSSSPSRARCFFTSPSPGVYHWDKV
jgi:hypothetical protein